jgi:AraC family transcriptional regulator
MQVSIVDFPDTRVAAVEHLGPPELEQQTAMRLVEWRIRNRVPPDRHETYGVHYTDPSRTSPDRHRVDFCVAYDGPIEPNAEGVTAKVIPGGRCAVARYVGSRAHIPVAEYLYEVWLPQSGESLRDFPLFFHYVNVGPGVQEHEMITDVYLPLRR